MRETGRKPEEQLVVSTAPFVHATASTRWIMAEVFLSLLPIVVLAVWFFGIGVLLVVAGATAGAVSIEWIFSRRRDRTTVGDYSALLTGLLLGLTLPPAFPVWMALLGGVVGVGLGKLIWGGLGYNVFNPALVGRAFLQAAFPSAITTWSVPGAEVWTIPPSVMSFPLMQPQTDAISTATPLALAKFSQQTTELPLLLLGNVSGSLGETSAIALLLCGLWLGARRLFDWRLPAGTLLSVALLSGFFSWWRPELHPSVPFALCSGGLLFAAVYMVTDPVTTPTTPAGAWIFGLGVGFLTVLIRLFGGLPEGVMYAILLMNAATPYINHYTQRKPFGDR